MFRVVSKFQPLLCKRSIILAACISFGFCHSHSDFQCFHPSSSVSFLALVPGGNAALTCLYKGNPGFHATYVCTAFLQPFIALFSSSIFCLCSLFVILCKGQVVFSPGSVAGEVARNFLAKSLKKIM